MDIVGNINGLYKVALGQVIQLLRVNDKHLALDRTPPARLRIRHQGNEDLAAVLGTKKRRYFVCAKFAFTGDLLLGSAD